MRARSIFYEKMEGGIGEGKRRSGSEGRNPRGVERVHRAVNPLKRPRSPLPRPPPSPAPYCPPSQPGVVTQLKATTRLRADSAWNPEEEPGYRQPLASRLCGARDPQDPHEGKPLCAPFSCSRLPGSQRLEREPRVGLFGSACLQTPF